MKNGKTNYAKLIGEAEKRLANSEKQLDDQHRRADRSARRYADLIAQGKQDVEQAKRDLRQAQRQEYVDQLNSIRDKAYPLALELDENIGNLRAQRELKKLYAKGQDAARALANGNAVNRNFPFVAVDRALARATEGPLRDRPKSAMHALGLANEDGERVVIK